MKKSIQLFALCAVIGLAVGYFGADAVARTTGYLYGDALVIGYPGTTVASISTAGALTVTGFTNTGALANTGAFSNTGDVSVVGAVVVSSSSTTGYDCKDYAAVAALPTTNVSECSRAYLVTDHKIYVATAASSVAGCVSGNCFVAVH